MMEKEVVRYPRSTTKKDDICYKTVGEYDDLKLLTDKKICKDCRTHIATDRFLSKKFQKKIMKDDQPYPFGTYPYILIADSSKCNFRCRPCYSWRYWEPKFYTKPINLKGDELAEQFRCKIVRLHDENLLNGRRIGDQREKRPFSRLRISGGEPLYDERGLKRGINFWLEFFSSLDKKFDDLIRERINLKTDWEWEGMSDTERKENFPVFLESDNGKIRLRFDTNGFLFNDPLVAEKFVGGVYELNLDNITIDLTFSLKGTNKHEVNWMIDPKSKFDSSKVGKKEPLNEHPQWLALQNLKEKITEYEDEMVLEKESSMVISEDYFNSHGDFSLVIERGIMNNPREKLYLYDKNESLPWNKFNQQLRKKGLSLTETENRIYLKPECNTKGIAWRYIKGNYEFTIRDEKRDVPIFSYSKKNESETSSKNHEEITSKEDDNLKALENKIKSVWNDKIGSSDHWIELIPIVPG